MIAIEMYFCCTYICDLLSLVGCVCSAFIDEDGHGNCAKKFQEQYGCYVKDPTECKDTIPSYGRLYSVSEACNRQGMYYYYINLTEIYMYNIF